MTLIDRGFRRLSSGQVHYRSAGTDTGAPPLLMIHGGPGSSASLVPLMTALSAGRRVIAPDLMGNGDSDPLPPGPAIIEEHARQVAELLDVLGLGQIDVYGHHSGAQVACEMAIANPRRIRRLALNGLALFSREERAEFAARYAPPIAPVADGSHLFRIWDFAANLTRYFPHYRQDDAHRIEPATTLPPEALTRIVVDILRAWPTCHRLYEAAFAHDLSARLSLVDVPSLVVAVDGDPLVRYADTAVGLMSESRIANTSRDGLADLIGGFLAGQADKSRL